MVFFIKIRLEYLKTGYVNRMELKSKKKGVLFMEKIVKRFDDGLQIAYYEFSKDIVCIEVHQYGKNMGAFCSDVSYFQEWDETDLVQLAKTHVTQVKSAQNLSHPNRKQVADYQIEYNTYFDDMVCVNVFQNDDQLAAFCSDRHSFEEWVEDEELFAQVLRSQVQ